MDKLEISNDSSCINVQAELCLLGNIFLDLSLLEQYEIILEKEDFGDPAMSELYMFVKDYYKIFGPNTEPEKLASHYAQYVPTDKAFKKYLPFKSFQEHLVTLKRLGTPEAGANSSHFRDVKKYSVLRKLQKAGVNIEPILSRTDFYTMDAKSILEEYQQKLDDISENIEMEVSEDIGRDLVGYAKHLLEAPEHGLQTPLPFINEHMHGLCKNDLTMIGGLSNSGKGRFLVSLLVHLVCVEGQSVYLMSNEMTRDDYEKALLCTITNMDSIQALHGHKLDLDQAAIVQSLFCDENGELLERLPGEDTDSFFDRLCSKSKEYAEFVEVIAWYQENFADKIKYVNVMDDYSTARIKREINNAVKRGCTVIAYDTLKGYQSSEWGDLVQTATVLSEAVKSSTAGIHGLATIQLTDSTHTCLLEELDSSKIAVGKHIMHVADNLIMFKHLKNPDKAKYKLVSNGEEFPLTQVPDEITLTCFRIVKNRRGGGKEDLHALQTNLNRNRWVQVGKYKKK